MTKLNRNLEYAIMALDHFRRSPDLSSVKDLSTAWRVPFDTLSRVLQKLVKAKILTSTQGVGGGYNLSGNLDSLTVYELLFIVQGPVEIARCIGDRPEDCSLSSICKIKSPIELLNVKLVDFYKSVKVLDLLLSSDRKVDAASSITKKEVSV